MDASHQRVEEDRIHGSHAPGRLDQLVGRHDGVVAGSAQRVRVVVDLVGRVFLAEARLLVDLDQFDAAEALLVPLEDCAEVDLLRTRVAAKSET